MGKTTDRKGPRKGPSPSNGSGSDNDLTPISVSYIYDFQEGDMGLAGDGGGRPGTLGGPLGERIPRYKVFTYPYIPGSVLAEDIGNT